MGESLLLVGPYENDFVYGSYHDWDDAIRSMEVGLIEKLHVTCYWNKILSANGKITQAIEIGWSSTETKVTETILSQQFSMAVEDGFSFEGASSKITLT